MTTPTTPAHPALLGLAHIAGMVATISGALTLYGILTDQWAGVIVAGFATTASAAGWWNLRRIGGKP